MNLPLQLAGPSENVLILLSHSNDGLMEYCARKFEFVHLFKKIPPRETRDPEALALSVGTAMHEAIQELIRAKHTKDLTINAFDQALYTLALYWDFEREDAKRPMGAAVRLLEMVDADPFWNDWELCYIDGFGLAIEVPFRIIHEHAGALDLQWPKGYTIATQGKADFIVRHKRTGEIRVIDIKTTTMARELWETLYKWSDQGVYYSFPVQAVSGKVVGTGLNVTYYMVSFGSDAEQNLAVQPNTFWYSEDDIASFVKIKDRRLRELHEFLTHGFPRRTHGCVIYGKPCPYFKVCGINDSEYLKQWFSFEQWESADRVYTPVWTFTD